jgi:5-methylcytosine-specific restriction endonuclease McrA
MSARRFVGRREIKLSRWVKLYHRRREALLELLGHRCRFCGATEQLTFDHIRPADWPRRKYSSHERLKLYLLEARAGLLQVLCLRCNSRKGARTYTQQSLSL